MDVSKYVNLRSYSSSEGFVGYAQYIGDDLIGGTQTALLNLDSFIASIGGEFVVFTTLAFKGNEKTLEGIYNYQQYEFKNYVGPAVKENMVSEVYDEFCEFREIEYNAHRKIALRSACYLVMALGGGSGPFLYIF